MICPPMVDLPASEEEEETIQRLSLAAFYPRRELCVLLKESAAKFRLDLISEDGDVNDPPKKKKNKNSLVATFTVSPLRCPARRDSDLIFSCNT